MTREELEECCRDVGFAAEEQDTDEDLRAVIVEREAREEVGEGGEE